MFVKSAENYIDVTDFGCINLPVTLDCGQAFRWTACGGSFSGVVRGVQTTVCTIKGGIRLYGVSDEVFTDIFLDYFDLMRDYDAILSRFKQDKTLARAAEEYGVIRILRQEPWETLCTFIISACNNIPRIKGIVDRLCRSFGDRAGTSFAFPSAERIAALSLEQLEVIRAGYRAPYILSAARSVADGSVDLEALKLCSLDECRKALTKISGVGKKVADCTALFSLGHIDAFPVDRHIARICEKYYPDGLPECIDGARGIAQQYMFHFQRMSGD